MSEEILVLLLDNIGELPMIESDYHFLGHFCVYAEFLDKLLIFE